MKKLLLLPLLVVACLVGGTSVRVIAMIATTLTEPTLTNISTRAFVQTGDNVVIGGFVVERAQPNFSPAQPKRVIIRAIGPDLSQYGIPNALANPTLELHDGTGALIASNNILNFTNLDPNGTTAQYDATTGVLSIFRYSHQVATITMPGLNANAQFLVTPNGGGSNISLLP